MQLRFEIPDSFWSLFRSVNREVYIEALLCINEEYQYSNYFLTREICIQALSDLYVKQQIELRREEDETEIDLLETPASRILNWLLRTGWLEKGRRLQYIGDQYRDPGLCGGDDRRI